MTQRTTLRATTGDRGPPDVEIHTTEQLSPNISRTPNGNLLCRNVPIARVGWMVYGPGETPIDVHPQTGFARVYRSEEELFSPETIGSFMGAAVVDEHPESDVTPENWKKLSKGFSTNDVRRGEGPDSDVLLADLIISDADLISSVLQGKREVSCGYDADYENTGVGEGKQTKIIGNHIALVEKGRCGPRCAIGDHAFNPRKEIDMPNKRVKLNAERRALVLDNLRKATQDAEGLLEGIDNDADGEANGGSSDDSGATHIHIHTNGASGPMATQSMGPSGAGSGGEITDDAEGEGQADPIEARFQKIEGVLAQILAKLGGGTDDDIDGDQPQDPDEEMMASDSAPGGDPDMVDGDGSSAPDKQMSDMPDAKGEEVDAKGKFTGDSAALQTAYQNLISNAEILVPGFRLPTFDGAAKRKATVDAMCGARKRVLDLAYATKDGQALIESVHGGAVDLSKLDCVQAASLFKAAAGAKRLINNRAAVGDGKLPEAQPAKSHPQTLADLNAQYSQFWASKQGQA